MGQVTIASIYPITVGISRPRFIPDSELWIKGVPEGSSVDVIKERVKNPKVIFINEQHESNKAPITHIDTMTAFSADEVARDFIKHATQDSPGMSAGRHPGVWICAGTDPTSEEIRFYREVQSKFFVNRLEVGNSLATDPKTARAITWLMRVSAMALGREPEWLNPPSDLDITECPYCRKSVPINAAVCGHCSNVVNVEIFAALDAKKKAALKAHVAA